MIRRGDTLVPAAQMFLEDLRAVPEGKPLDISAKRSRSLPHHRRFFAKLRKLCQAGAWEQDEESLLSYIKLGVGHVLSVVDNSSTLIGASNLLLAEEMVDKYPTTSHEAQLARFVISLAGPKSYLVPKSISFEAMDETAFHDFEMRADQFIGQKFGIDPEKLMQEAADMVAEQPEPDAAILTREKKHDQPDRDLEAEKTSDDAPKGDIAEPLEDRLTRLALRLDQDSPHEITALWATLKVADDTIQLYREAPDAVKLIVEACQAKAAKRVTKQQFDAAIDGAIEKAIGAI